MRRALLGILEGALLHVPAGARPTPATVHELRKTLKRARAMLRLLRPALVAHAYERADAALRAAGKRLSAARDAQVGAALYAKLERETRPAAARGSRRASAPASAGAPSAADMAAVRAAVDRARAALDRASLAGSGWAGLGAGFRAVYRQARRRMPCSRRGATVASLHAWRRSTKRYWHVLEVFEAIRPRRLGAAIRDAHRLSDLLGDDHDLALLQQQIGARRRQPQPADARMLRTIGPRRTALQTRALQVGKRLYEDRPRRAEARLQRDWERWRERERGPASRRRVRQSRRRNAATTGSKRA